METAVRLLGPFAVTVGGLDVTPSAPKERALLALLAVHHGHVVSADRLADELWPDLDPARARRALQVRIAGLRQLLSRAGAAASIEYVAPGYRLVISPDAIDEQVFGELATLARARARAGDFEAARTTLRRAIGTFFDEPLVGVGSSPSLDAEADRLRAARLDAVEDWIDAELACGHHHAAVGELDRLVVQNPLRERLWAQWIIALYRCGRQAEALRACSLVRRRLVAELGVEPSAELQDLELGVLQHRPELAWSPPRPPPGAITTSRGRSAEGWAAMPPLRFARSTKGVNIGYRVLGDGPDLIIVPGFISHLDMWWESSARRLVERLSSTNRLILFDKRGTGLSDRPANVDIADWLDDTRAVLDAVGSERAAVVGMSAGGAVAILFAATNTDRVESLVVYGGWARVVKSADYPIGLPPNPDGPALVAANWGTGAMFETSCPSGKDDPWAREQYARYQRMAASPASAAAYIRLLSELDLRDVLSTLEVPTLVLHASRDQDVPIELARYIAKRIKGAALVEIDSADHMLWFHDSLDRIAEEISDFVNGASPGEEVSRVVATVLFVDPIDAFGRSGGTRDERDVRLVRDDDRTRRIIKRFRGHEIQHREDGLLATFDGPARAIRCAVALRAEMRAQGVELRAGLHTGECETMGADIGGIAVQIARGVARLARPGQVMASQTVRDLVLGSAITFGEPCRATISEVQDEWHVYAVTGV